MRVDSGECYAQLMRYVYDTETGSCRPFTYGGCGGNRNRFTSLHECENTCSGSDDAEGGDKQADFNYGKWELSLWDPAFQSHKLFYWVDLWQIASIGHVNIGVILLFLGNSRWFISSIQLYSNRLFHIQSKLLKADWLTQYDNGKVTLHFNMPYSHGLWNHQT